MAKSVNFDMSASQLSFDYEKYIFQRHSPEIIFLQMVPRQLPGVMELKSWTLT